MIEKVKIGELEIPADYWSLEKKNKRELCLTIIEAILVILDKQVAPEISRTMILDRLLDSSIESNIEDENYEICAVLTDIKSILNEPID